MGGGDPGPSDGPRPGRRGRDGAGPLLAVVLVGAVAGGPGAGGAVGVPADGGAAGGGGAVRARLHPGGPVGAPGMRSPE